MSMEKRVFEPAIGWSLRPMWSGLLALGAAIAMLAGAAAADEPVLRISVTDAETGAAIQEFRILAGVPVGRPASGLSGERPGAEAVNWQPHTTKIGQQGEYIWPMARAWEKTGFRAEADGYIPQRSIWVEKKPGEQVLEFKLAKDPGVDGEVLLPDGRIARAALIGIGLIQRNVRIKGVSLQGAGEPLPERPGDRWRRPTIAETDAKGKFTLTTETDPAAIVVAVHPKGICEMPFAEFARERSLHLRQWGRVEGQVSIGGEPGAGESVSLSIQRDSYGYPEIVSASMQTKCGADGSFVFENVPPGMVQVSLFEYFPKVDRGMRTSFSMPIPDGAYKHVEVKSGGVTRLELGGEELRQRVPAR